MFFGTGFHRVTIYHLPQGGGPLPMVHGTISAPPRAKARRNAWLRPLLSQAGLGFLAFS